MLSRFHLIPIVTDGQTDGQTDIIAISISRVSVLTRDKKAREVTTSPIPPRHAPFPIATIFGVWGQLADVINHANFYLNQSKGYPSRGGQNLPYSIDLMYRPYNSVSTNVLHCDTARYVIDWTQDSSSRYTKLERSECSRHDCLLTNFDCCNDGQD